MSTRFLARKCAPLLFVLGCLALAGQTSRVRAQTEENAASENSVSLPSPSRDLRSDVRDPAAATPNATPTPDETLTPDATLIPDETPEATPTETPTATATPTFAPTATPSVTPTPNVALSASKSKRDLALPRDPNIAADHEMWNATPLAQTVRQMKLSLPLPAPRIVVLKAQRRLELWNGAQLVKTYRVSLGANPVGAKSRQHDGRTPEGHFRICTRNASTSAFHIFLGLSYPDVPDAARGLNSGAISWREYALIQRKLASRGAPLWETRLGGWVGIHGGSGNDFARKQAQKRGRSDWTAGCIALTDREIEELYSATKMGTPVWVRP